MNNQKGKIIQFVGLLTLVLMAIVLVPNLSQAGLGITEGITEGITAGTPDIVSLKERMMEDALNLYRHNGQNNLEEGAMIKEAAIDCAAERENSFGGYNGFSGAPMLAPFRPGRVALW